MLDAGDRAASFELADLSGKRYSLAAVTEHGPVLLAFFKVSCPTCQFTFPFLQRIAASGGLSVVGISQDSPEATEEFRKRFGLQFLLLLDELARNYPVSNAFRITNVPSLFLVEPDGAISFADKGFSRASLQGLGQRFNAPVFHEGEKTPDFRPG